MITRILAKLKDDKARAVIVAPQWQSAWRWPSLEWMRLGPTYITWGSLYKDRDSQLDLASSDLVFPRINYYRFKNKINPRFGYVCLFLYSMMSVILIVCICSNVPFVNQMIQLFFHPHELHYTNCNTIHVRYKQ